MVTDDLASGSFDTLGLKTALVSILSPTERLSGTIVTVTCPLFPGPTVPKSHSTIVPTIVPSIDEDTKRVPDGIFMDRVALVAAVLPIFP